MAALIPVDAIVNTDRRYCAAGVRLDMDMNPSPEHLPNTSGVTRFSIDFRTVHLGDVTAVRGARNV
ncbi:hypothetical protein ACWELQ_33145, partial [Nocardia sp. NPDC004722]